jgi:hypothetical protein
MRTNFLLYEGIISAVKYSQNKLNIVIPLDYGPIDNVTWKCIKKGNKQVQQVLTDNVTWKCIKKGNTHVQQVLTGNTHCFSPKD